MKSLQNNQRGMSLIELMVAMVVGLIVMGVIYSIYQSQQKSFLTQQLVVDMLQNSRAAMSLMKRELRMAGYDPVAADGVDNDGLNGIDDAGETADAGFWEARSDMIQFEADINYDGDDDDTSENVTYRIVNGTELERRAKDAAGVYRDQILAYDIQSLAVEKIETLKVLPYDDADLDEGNNPHQEQAGGYSIVWEVEEALDLPIKTITITVSNANRNAKDVILSTIIAQGS